VPKLLTHRKDAVGKETKSQPVCILPGDGAERGLGTRAREGGASPVPVPSGCVPTASLPPGHSRGSQGSNSKAQSHFTRSLPACW